MSKKKEAKAFVRALLKQGCTVERTGGGHLKVTTPGGEMVYTGSTPSDLRSWLNARARLRRAGVDL